MGTADRTKPYKTNKCTLAGTHAGMPLNRGVVYSLSQTMEAWFGSCPKHVAEHRPTIAPWWEPPAAPSYDLGHVLHIFMTACRQVYPRRNSPQHICFLLQHLAMIWAMSCTWCCCCCCCCCGCFCCCCSYLCCCC